jgi:transcriptional regulator with PAS, ATPase and Fis domain
MNKNIDLNTNKEVERLVKNHKSLLDVLPEMIFLIAENKIIQHMNKAAIHAFGNLQGQFCSEHLCNANDNCTLGCPLLLTLNNEQNAIPADIIVGDINVEYTYLPFLGYEGHHLMMLIMHDITKRISREKEIEQFNQDIETILSAKIEELKESQQVRNHLNEEMNLLKNKLGQERAQDGMIGKCKQMKAIRAMVHQVGPTDSTVLITGESGTGKEVVAQLIHKNSNRANKPFLAINCSSLTDELLESELFGHEKGSFTGANALKKGHFETFNNGTIFLDEIGDITPRMQSAILRVLQNGEIKRIGGSHPIKINVRIIAATNKDLSLAINNKEFRLDLFYRLNVININVPPLRERKEDILHLTIHFISVFRKTFNKTINFVPNEIIDKLLKHNWPGNIRELENILHRAVLISKDSMLTTNDIIFDDNRHGNSEKSYFNDLTEKLADNSLKETLAQAEKDLIEHTLKETNGDVPAAIKALEIGKTAFYSKIKKYKITLS